ncbi:hypothetical protein GCM10017688_30910 [Streptomyces ramulosus]
MSILWCEGPKARRPEGPKARRTEILLTHRESPCEGGALHRATPIPRRLFRSGYSAAARFFRNRGGDGSRAPPT